MVRYEITDRAKEGLGKVALVLKNQPIFELMVEAIRIMYHITAYKATGK